MWSIKVTADTTLTRTGVVAPSIIERESVTIDGAVAFDGKVFGIGSGDKHDVAVT